MFITSQKRYFTESHCPLFGSSQWKVADTNLPSIMGFVVPGVTSLLSPQSNSSLDWLQNETSGQLERTENWQLDITVAGTSCVWKYGSELTYYFPPGSRRKLTTLEMQSESGIVPDFEVGEDFQEEPKTYYELKSQPLQNRSVNGAFDSSQCH